ncbi:MAG: N-6 DNA methylase [Anaerolineales bacterium]
MKKIKEILNELATEFGLSRQQLAIELMVSPSTISRWMKGLTVPSPDNEGKLRGIHLERKLSGRRVAEPNQPYRLQLAMDDFPTNGNISQILADLREAFHRRGTLASRNEAIDELSKLLFADVMTDGGLAHALADAREGSEYEMARDLRSLVKITFASSLPELLGHEMEPSDFELRLKETEGTLAREIIDIFSVLSDGGRKSSQPDRYGVDVLNDVFGAFLTTSFIDEKELGQYLTPPEIVQFMVNLVVSDLDSDELETLLDPNHCEKSGFILDPSCGVASFLVAAAQILGEKVRSRHGEEALQRWLYKMGAEVLVGLDKSERMIRLALTNTAMLGLPAAQLHLVNSLSRQTPEIEITSRFMGRAGLILTNPPFGASFTGQDLAEYAFATDTRGKRYSKVNSEVLFLERYLDWLAPGGRLVAIIPDSILTNTGIYEHVRRKLEERIEIRAIVSLPTVTFGAAGTNTKTSVLYARKFGDGVIGEGKTFFAICDDVGYNVKVRGSQRRKESNGNGDLPKILEAFQIDGKDAMLGRWVSGLNSSSRWDAGYNASLPRGIAKRLELHRLSDVLLSDVAKLVNERADPRRWGDHDFLYIEISDIDSGTYEVRPKSVESRKAPSRARKLVRSGDVLFSTVRPERRTIGVVGTEHDGAVCSTGLAVIRPSSISPIALASLLKSDFVTAQVLRNTHGISYPAVDESCLVDILLPIAESDLQTLDSVAGRVEDAQGKYRRSTVAMQDSLDDAIKRWED